MNENATKSEVIFEKSVKNRFAYSLPACDVPEQSIEGVIPQGMLRANTAELPELSEVDVLRHFIGLSDKNYGVLSGFYPLGSCTMKYNPAVNEKTASLAGFIDSHPLIGDEYSQGSLRLMYELQNMLSEVTGMDSFSLQPSAGSHGELSGLLIIKAYHEKRGDIQRTRILIPDSAHGTNPASASVAGFESVHVNSDADGNIDLDDLRSKTDDRLAGLMLTNPNTLGLFEVNICEISKIVHDAGGLLYYDGANQNAIMGVSRPGDMGFDVMHLNLHKTFSTPHGGGGPGAGPVGVVEELAPYLPCPSIVLDANGKYRLNYDMPDSIGRVRSFFGNFGVLVRAYTFILSMGAGGLKAASENAVLNANYLKVGLSEFMKIGYDRTCMHEFVVSGSPLKEKGVSTLDVAKRMLDFTVHPPTVYFPLIVKEAMMFEPTETESKKTLDMFVEIMRGIVAEADENPDLLKTAPHNTVVGRLDDVKAARKPVLKWEE
ncbi:MAG: aminomethyl-transferring glycine dehydrogenase subunit GcvPB [Oscillospiraceae bacterium]|nr:aminomethyl-transferring glycine dehydrogenase subunit GcvPB [Oscillospiraceae bacterium]